MDTESTVDWSAKQLHRTCGIRLHKGSRAPPLAARTWLCLWCSLGPVPLDARGPDGRARADPAQRARKRLVAASGTSAVRRSYTAQPMTNAAGM
jgi:hypothetical protein